MEKIKTIKIQENIIHQKKLTIKKRKMTVKNNNMHVLNPS